MKNFQDIKASEKVESVEHVGGGISRITLKSGFGNRNEEGYHSANQQFCAVSEEEAIAFVEGAKASTYASTPGGNPCRVAEGTPWACNPHSETYWCS